VTNEDVTSFASPYAVQPSLGTRARSRSRYAKRPMSARAADQGGATVRTDEVFHNIPVIPIVFSSNYSRIAPAKEVDQ